MKIDESRKEEGIVTIVGERFDVDVITNGKVWGINWNSSITVTTDEAREFSALLDAAITKCEELNRTK